MAAEADQKWKSHLLVCNAAWVFLTPFVCTEIAKAMTEQLPESVIQYNPDFNLIRPFILVRHAAGLVQHDQGHFKKCSCVSQESQNAGQTNATK